MGRHRNRDRMGRMGMAKGLESLTRRNLLVLGNILVTWKAGFAGIRDCLVRMCSRLMSALLLVLDYLTIIVIIISMLQPSMINYFLSFYSIAYH